MAEVQDFKTALTRKFGPLPAWGWAGIAGGGVWWYRQHVGTTGDQSGGTDASNPAYVGPYGEYPAQIDGGSGAFGPGAFGPGDTGISDPSAPAPSPAPVINIAAPPAPAGRPRAQKPKPQHKPKPIKDRGPWRRGGKTLITKPRSHAHTKDSRNRKHQGFSSTVKPVKPRKPPAKKAPAKGRKRTTR